MKFGFRGACSIDESLSLGTEFRYFQQDIALGRSIGNGFHAVNQARISVGHYVLNLKPPFAQTVLPVHQPLSGVHSIAMTPATS